MMKDQRMNITYDFEDEGKDEFDNKEQYACPVLDGDNENNYGFGYCYEYDDIFPVFVGGIASWKYLQLWEGKQRQIASRQERGKCTSR